MVAKGCELIEALERQWRDALCAKNIDLLRSLIHADFVLIGTRASGPFTLNRDEWLEAIQKRELVRIELEVVEATVLDQVMVGTVQAKWCVKYLGREIEDSVLLTDVWVFDDGRWRVVRRHSSPVPAMASVAV
ncbi:nuclear transport factor 2 family protein [Sphingomonas sp.]|uniref:nuclear transport factor 2 family protein n=1 Tax=Sphingomonas sp. TaxID=28214 RepID=UPI00286CA8E4|nr:nuclear transport factor 2 family protein [Sphingomonas sp.]